VVLEHLPVTRHQQLYYLVVFGSRTSDQCKLVKPKCCVRRVESCPIAFPPRIRDPAEKNPRPCQMRKTLDILQGQSRDIFFSISSSHKNLFITFRNTGAKGLILQWDRRCNVEQYIRLSQILGFLIQIERLTSPPLSSKKLGRNKQTIFIPSQPSTFNHLVDYPEISQVFLRDCRVVERCRVV